MIVARLFFTRAVHYVAEVVVGFFHETSCAFAFLGLLDEAVVKAIYGLAT